MNTSKDGQSTMFQNPPQAKGQVMRETSLMMFKKVSESGLLSRWRLKVYEILCNSQERMTAHELRKTAYRGYNINNTEHLPKRLSELERMGVIKTYGSRECKVTKNTALVWGVTGEMPTALPTINKKEDAQNVLRDIWKLTESQEGKAKCIKLSELIKNL